MSEPHIDGGAVTQKAGSFLTQETAGVPNWVWGVVVVAGVGLAVFVPKLLNGGAAGNTTSGGTGVTPSGGVAGSGLGLAVDPSTGLPYAVSGLVPTGQTVETTGGTPPPPTSPPPQLQTPPPATQTPPPTPAQYITVPRWPNYGSTLTQIASQYGTSVNQLLSLNPNITNPNLIYAGSRLRVR